MWNLILASVLMMGKKNLHQNKINMKIQISKLDPSRALYIYLLLKLTADRMSGHRDNVEIAKRYAVRPVERYSYRAIASRENLLKTELTIAE